MKSAITHMTSFEVPLGEPLATINDRGELLIWPAGIGKGPAILLDVAGWEQIKHSADEALRVRRQELERGK